MGDRARSPTSLRLIEPGHYLRAPGLIIGFLVLLRRKVMTYSDPQRFYIAQLILYVGTVVIVVVTLIAKRWAR